MVIFKHADKQILAGGRGGGGGGVLFLTKADT